MKTSTMQARNSRPTSSRIVMALAAASVIGGMATTPAFADNDHRNNNHRQSHRDNGRHNGEWRGNHNRGFVQPFVYTQPYYQQPVYAPAPVYYPPQPSPGINLVFPLNIRR